MGDSGAEPPAGSAGGVEWRGGAGGLAVRRSVALGRRPVRRQADRLTQAKARIAELERLVGQQQADLHFFAKPCGSGTRPAPTAARPPLRGRPNDDRRRAARLSPRRRQRGTAVPIGRRVARRLLSAFRTPSAQARRRRLARSHSKDRARQPPTAIAGSPTSSGVLAFSSTTSGCAD
jgi:hypothetical protein